jgi:LacI family transcriptional regulator
MSRPFLVKDIAQQAGVSVATVDRVLNNRPNVRAHMARRVEQAIEALQRQRRQVGAVGRKFMVDLVMDTPQRFSSAVRAALEREMSTLRPSIFRARHELHEAWAADDLVATLHRIAVRGSHGVLLKAPDLPVVVDAVGCLTDKGIPVITLVTDLPSSSRLAYVGLDNRAAGETAAYLLGQWLPPGPRVGVLVSMSSAHFRGEEEREIAFRAILQSTRSDVSVHTISEGQGVEERTTGLVQAQLRAHPHIAAVYSIGGANEAIWRAFDQMARPCRCFIGHDLDDDNLALLRAGRLNAVLDHDLRHDMRHACLRILAAHGAGGDAGSHGLSSVDVVTPFNLPEPLRGDPQAAPGGSRAPSAGDPAGVPGPGAYTPSPRTTGNPS